MVGRGGGIRGCSPDWLEKDLYVEKGIAPGSKFLATPNLWSARRYEIDHRCSRLHGGFAVVSDFGAKKIHDLLSQALRPPRQAPGTHWNPSGERSLCHRLAAGLYARLTATTFSSGPIHSNF